MVTEARKDCWGESRVVAANGIILMLFLDITRAAGSWPPSSADTSAVVKSTLMHEDWPGKHSVATQTYHQTARLAEVAGKFLERELVKKSRSRVFQVC